MAEPAGRWPPRSAAPACWAARAQAMRVSLMPMAGRLERHLPQRQVLERMMRATLGTTGWRWRRWVLGARPERGRRPAPSPAGQGLHDVHQALDQRVDQPPKKPDISPINAPMRQPSPVAPTQRQARCAPVMMRRTRAAHEIGAEHARRRAAPTRRVGGERVEGGLARVQVRPPAVSAAHRGPSRGARRTGAAHQPWMLAPARQLGTMIDDRHGLLLVLDARIEHRIHHVEEITNTTMMAMNITRFCTIG